MDGLFESLNDLFHTDLIVGFQEHYGFDLSDDAIADSVHEASEFFNMCDPMITIEGHTTGVALNNTWMPNDDVLIFNRDQMTELGITDKEGFDLVLTHEVGHRMLQGMREQTHFNSYQEELCCDYMAGVRAGLNGMDEGKMESSLAGTQAGPTHPDGEARVESVENGVRFAHDFMEKYHKAPTFLDCLEDFESTDVCVDACSKDQINLSSDDDMMNHHTNDNDVKGFVEDRAWHLKKAANYAEKEKIELHEAKLDSDAGRMKEAAEHARLAASYHKAMENEKHAASICDK